MTVLNHAQQSQLETQKHYDILEKKWNELTEQFHMDKQRIRTLEQEQQLSIRKDDAINLKQMTEHLQTELVETKAAMITYKNMTEVIADQARGLKLAMERKKDENENLVNAVREIASQSEDQKRLGKLYYLIMLSRWQEAAVNKKYEMILTENRELRKDFLNTDQMFQNKEYEHHEAENIIQDRQLMIEKLKKQISDSKNIFLSLDKAEQLSNIIKEISDEKTDLEEQYFSIRTKYRATQATMDDAIVKAEYYQEELEIVMKAKQSEMSDRMIELSQKLQAIRLSEMRSQRESNENKEKNTYLSRLLRNQNDQLRKLEEKASEYESKMHKREEEFRRADNDRMRRFFNARFDDIPGALNASGDFSGSGGGFPSQRKENRGQSAATGFSPSQVKRQQSDREMAMYEEPAYVRRQNTVNSNEGKLVEGKLKRIEQELQSALEQLRQKDHVISQFKQWQLDDKYLSENEVIRDAMEKQRGKVTQVHEQESKEMAEAAAQMVRTLQEMLDQKNEQLKAREEMIEKLRKQMLDQREQDGLEIGRLQNQLGLAAGTTLSKLQQIVMSNENNAQSRGYGTRYDKLTREELSRTLDEKDEVLQKLSSELQAAEKQIVYLKQKNQHVLDQVSDLEHELMKERQQLELKAKTKELERIRKELKDKDAKNTNLQRAIDALNERMTEYAIKNSNVSEDQKMALLNEDLNKKKFDNESKKLKTKYDFALAAKEEKAKELQNANLKVQEQLQTEQKLILEKDELAKALKSTRDRLDQEIRLKEKALIELNNIKGKVQINSGFGSSVGPTFEQLQARNKELENDIIILQCQQKTVVVYNKEVGTFEYIGEPIFLNNERDLADIDEILASMRAWLTRNDRLTIKSIFESLDKDNFGELSIEKFEIAMKKIGIKLRLSEKRIIQEVLDPRNIGYIRYRPLIKELSGIPQIEFMIKEILKLGKLVDARDLTERDFKNLLDPRHEDSMNLTQLQDSFKQINNEQFQMKAEEVEFLFKHVTKSVRTIGVVMSVDKLTEKVFTAVNALLIEKAKDAISKSVRPFNELFTRHDSNKDGCLEYGEFENLLLDCQLALKPAMFERFLLIADPGKKLSRVSMNSLRFLISGEASSHASTQPEVSRSYDYEPSLHRATLSEETSQEEITICRNAARKIMGHFQNSNQKSLQDLMTQKDKHNEGIISREDLFSIILESKIPELTNAEANILMRYADKTTKGYLAIANFMEKLVELATETKQEIYIRTFAMNVKRQGVNLKTELLKYDTARNGRLDKKTFSKALNQLPITMTEDGLDILFQAGESPDFRGSLDIKSFIDKVSLALRAKAPQFQQQQQAKAPSKLGAGKDLTGKGAGGAFENWEIEKKYQTKLKALQQQIEESKKETQDVEKQVKHWQEMATKFEREKTALQARMVDLNAKPPKAAQMESMAMAQMEQLQEYKDKVFYLQEQNNKLDKAIRVELKSEVAKLQRENERLAEKLKHTQEELRKQEHQVERLIGQPMDNLEKREEMELMRELRIQRLEQDLQAAESRESELSADLFKAEDRVRDLRYEKDQFDLQYARLQKRITDLEQYKLASAQLSATHKAHEGSELRFIEENSQALSNLTGQPGLHAQGKQDKDTVKLRSRSSKSVGELEMLVESLKRVIEKQKVENEQLARKVEEGVGRQDKLKSEKQLRQKIESLSQEVHSYEMKDINLDEKDKTARKLMEANRQLREDLRKEVDRYSLLENKYKDILVKYNILAKENAKNAEMIFAMNTGASKHNYERFLSKREETKDNDHEQTFERAF